MSILPRSLVVGFGGGAAPWLWFAIRDLDLFGVIDLVAILFPPIIALTSGTLLLIAFRTRRLAWLLPVISTVGVGIVSIISPWRAVVQPQPSSAAAPVTIVFANLLLSNVEPQVIDTLDALDADVVITAETNGTQFLSLSERFGPVTVSAGDEGGCSLDGPASCATVNIWTDLPAVVAPESEPLRAARGTRVDIETAGGPLRIYAAHLPAPSPLFWKPGRTTPSNHRTILEALFAELTSLDRSLLIGDLNLSDRQAGYREMTDDWRDLMRTSSTGPTSRRLSLAPLFLRIDHILASPDLCSSTSEQFKIPGSDHVGLVVTVGAC